jgi:DNA polymerase-4
MSARNNRILHIDGDSFFASCEIALDPKLEGRPVWVGGGRRGDGIVIAANRQAKKYGIKTGTACFAAKRLCPSGVLCRPHYDALRPSAFFVTMLTDGTIQFPKPTRPGPAQGQTHQGKPA